MVDKDFTLFNFGAAKKDKADQERDLPRLLDAIDRFKASVINGNFEGVVMCATGPNNKATMVATGWMGVDMVGALEYAKQDALGYMSASPVMEPEEDDDYDE